MSLSTAPDSASQSRRALDCPIRECRCGCALLALDCRLQRVVLLCFASSTARASLLQRGRAVSYQTPPGLIHLLDGQKITCHHRQLGALHGLVVEKGLREEGDGHTERGGALGERRACVREITEAQW